MRALAGALRIFGHLWLVLGCLLVMAGIAGVWSKGGFTAVQDLMSPFNFANYIAIVVTLAPGIGALVWSDKIRQKAATARDAS